MDKTTGRSEQLKALHKLDPATMLEAMSSLTADEQRQFLLLANKMTQAAVAPKKKRVAKPKVQPIDASEIALFNQFSLLESNVRANMQVASAEVAIMIDPTPVDFKTINQNPQDIETLGTILYD
jgi:hypothetical protein